MSEIIIDEKELNFLLLSYLSSQPQFHSILPQIEETFIQTNSLPTRHDWTGKEHKLSFSELSKQFSHLSPYHLIALLQNLISVVNQKTPFPCPSWTLLGQGDFSLLPRIGQTTNIKQKLSLKLRTPNSPILCCLPSMQQDPKFQRRHCLSNVIYQKYEKLFTIQGHKLAIYCVVFDQTTNRIITGSDDRLVKVWSSLTGSLLHTLRGHEAEISDLAIDEENKLLASAGTDQVIRIWNLENFSPVAVLKSHSKQITSVRFSTNVNDNYLLSTCYGGEVRLWDTLTWKEVSMVPDIPNERNYQVWCSGFSPGGKRFATGGSDGIVRIWSTITSPAVVIQPLIGHRPLPVHVIAWEHHGSHDCTARLWIWSAAMDQYVCAFVFESIQGRTDKCTMLCWSSDDRFIIVAFSSVIRVWDTINGKHIMDLNFHKKEVYVLDSHPNDPNIVFSAGYDGYVVLWDLRTGKPLKTLHETEAKISDGHFSRNGNYFVVSDKDGFFTLFGTGPQYKGVLTAQFFDTDYSPLSYDQEGWVIDATYQVPPHLIQRKILCNQHIEPYPDQPQNISYYQKTFDTNEYQTIKNKRLAYQNKELTDFSFVDQSIPIKQTSMYYPECIQKQSTKKKSHSLRPANNPRNHSSNRSSPSRGPSQPSRASQPSRRNYTTNSFISPRVYREDLVDEWGDWDPEDATQDSSDSESSYDATPSLTRGPTRQTRSNRIEHSPEMDLEQSFDSSHEDQSDELVDVMSFEEEDFDVTNEDLGLLQTGIMTRSERRKFQKETELRQRQLLRQKTLSSQNEPPPEDETTLTVTRRGKYKKVFEPEGHRLDVSPRPWNQDLIETTTSDNTSEPPKLIFKLTKQEEQEEPETSPYPVNIITTRARAKRTQPPTDPPPTEPPPIDSIGSSTRFTIQPNVVETRSKKKSNNESSSKDLRPSMGSIQMEGLYNMGLQEGHYNIIETRSRTLSEPRPNRAYETRTRGDSSRAYGTSRDSSSFSTNLEEESSEGRPYFTRNRKTMETTDTIETTQRSKEKSKLSFQIDTRKRFRNDYQENDFPSPKRARNQKEQLIETTSTPSDTPFATPFATPSGTPSSLPSGIPSGLLFGPSLSTDTETNVEKKIEENENSKTNNTITFENKEVEKKNENHEETTIQVDRTNRLKIRLSFAKPKK